MSFLVTFADGHATLFTERAAAELAASYWPHRKPTIRDLDQEARDREEMIGLLREFWSAGQVMVECMKCNNAKVGPDGKVLAVDGVMVPLGPGERWNPSLFNPLLPDEDGIRGRRPRCGRANYRYTDDDDQWEDRAADAFAKLAALLGRLGRLP